MGPTVTVRRKKFNPPDRVLFGLIATMADVHATSSGCPSLHLHPLVVEGLNEIVNFSGIGLRERVLGEFLRVA
jgi:hypothetical protein